MAADQPPAPSLPPGLTEGFTGPRSHPLADLSRLAALLAPVEVTSTVTLGIDPGAVEALAFAWLARERLLGRPGNLPAVTGARGPRVLGAVYAAPPRR